MPKRRLALSLPVYLVPVVFIICFMYTTAAAFDGPRDNKTGVQASDVEAAQRAQRAFKFGYALYDGAITPASHSEPEVGAPGSPTPPPPSPPAVSTAPMTVGEKFGLFARKSFLSPGAYALSILSGVYGEWTDDKNNHHHANPGDFAADSGTRAARSFAFRANANFFEKFMFASMFRQDPRYHRSYKKGAGAKIVYAASRVFVTQGDRNGKDEFNISFIAGGLAASGMANLWERDERRDGKHFATRFGTHVGLTALSNILREFLSGQ